RLQIREPPGPRDQEAGVGNPLPHRPECAQEEVPPLSLELSTDEQDRGGVCCGARATDGWRPVLGEIRARENGMHAIFGQPEVVDERTAHTVAQRENAGRV